MLKNILAAALIAVLSLPAFAVTEKEMEEAKAITAQAYLRYANDGSGYLDDFRASSMSQLESKLKAKEKENLKAFNTVKIPGDYASWDKAKLVEFWSVTFFTSPNLAEKGKGARTRVKQRISAMTIAASKAEETPKAEEPKAAEPTATEQTPAPSDSIVTSSADAQENILEKQEEILADQNAIAMDTEERQYKKEDNSTWIYVVVLIVLIGVVVWLVVFAANMMKKQAEPLEAQGQNPASASTSADNQETEKLRKELSAARTALNEYKTAFEESQAENKTLQSQIKSQKAEISRLKELAESASAASIAKAAIKSQAAEAPRKETPREGIYLGRVNSRGLFVRADRKYNPGHSIYRLQTRDGLVGTFTLINAPEVTDLGLDNPVEYLSGGCSAIDIEDTAGAQSIITENAGTAMFENGAWKVLRKSRIRFE